MNGKITIMAPLGNVVFNQDLIKRLTILKRSGISSISTDLWWSHFEPRKGVYDWSIAKEWIRVLKITGLKWVPIISLHECGGNVNDNFTINLPKYIQDEYISTESSFMVDNGIEVQEYVSFWNERIYERYRLLLCSFYNTFKNEINMISKLYVSMGPAGELRYPSYSPLFGWKYPEPGTLTCYSKHARESFHRYLENKYLTIETMNSEWGTHYMVWQDVHPPQHCASFFSQFFYTSNYGRDLLSWHQNILHRHFSKLASISNRCFGGKIRLGVKLSGVHWKFHQGRLAEKATGYVDESYFKLVRLIKKYDFDLTITCLEMETNQESGIDSILHNIKKACKVYGVKLYGENALPVYPGDKKAWANIQRNIEGIDGFTYLRWDIVFSDREILSCLKSLITTK